MKNTTANDVVIDRSDGVDPVARNSKTTMVTKNAAPKATAKRPALSSAPNEQSAAHSKPHPAKKREVAREPDEVAETGRGAERKPGKLASKHSKAKLLSGGNPKIAKADGDAPVLAYIKACPGWKQNVVRRLDALIVRALPDVQKAVKWNSPFYGVEDRGWFLSLHCFAKYVKVAFFHGASLRPLPPGESKQEHVRYLDVHEDDHFDEAQFTKWVKQASALPGWDFGRKS